MERLIAIGDIHGCYHTLKNLLDEVSYTSATDTIVFVGDYIDRGYYSYEVVSTIRKMQQQLGKDKVICLRGNHEQMAIDAYRRGKFDIWNYNGGQYTTYSFEEHGEDVKDIIPWFESLPLAYDTPEIFFCHAGLTYPMIEDNKPFDLIWGRDWIKTDTEPREKQVIFGHTPSRTGKTYTTMTGDICIDTACVFGGNLCAFVIQEDGESKAFYAPKAEEDKI